MIQHQRVIKARRKYNQWVADETLEDFALRFTALGARKWSSFQVCNTALGSISFLACEAIGGVITVSYGYTNAMIAIAVVGVLTFLLSFPISVYAARFGVDMDLLTRGGGFGYIGSTITSLIYACFTFILFAVEATIMSQALEMCLGIPLPIGHLISALMVIPMALHGIRYISRFQMWTQPIWLLLQLAPFIYLMTANAETVQSWTTIQGNAGTTSDVFDLLPFGFASAILLSFLPQIGEQVDFLRFMPPRKTVSGWSWWSALLIAGPGWIIIGAAKLIAGSFLAAVALDHGISVLRAVKPTELYHLAFFDLIHSPKVALALTGIFVVVCQTKINVTNAYAGSIAWSNFFSRLTHSHPGRVVWLIFNVVLALLLMEAGIFEIIDSLLGLYSNFAVAWIGALTADLIINKPLGLSPPTIEFRRAYLYNINPVGVGAMFISVTVSTASLFGLFGDLPRALAPFIGLAIAFTTAPLIAGITKGKYYIARPLDAESLAAKPVLCIICENVFDPQDMAHCPAYGGAICSLCCSLDMRCHDRCKTKESPFSLMERVSESSWLRVILTSRTTRFFRIMAILIAGSLAVLSLIYFQYTAKPNVDPMIVRNTLEIVFVGLLVVMGLTAWSLVLAQESRHLAEEETERQTRMLMDEIEAHERTDIELKKAKEIAEKANLAKTRFIAGLNHEIRSSLNSINGYAQLLERNTTPSYDAVRVIQNSSEHITRLMDELLDISRVESGSLNLYRNTIALHDFLDQVVNMVRLQAQAKGINFHFYRDPNLPQYVNSDEKRLRQVLINLLTNAIRYTEKGSASLEVFFQGQTADFIVSDTGIGIAPEEMKRIFEPFERGRSSQVTAINGTGLGLTIASLLITLLGGELTVTSEVGVGTRFRVRITLFEAAPSDNLQNTNIIHIAGFNGPPKTILICDNDSAHLNLMREVLKPLGFCLLFARNGPDCIKMVENAPPDLLILDISMPGMDGWEVAYTLRNRGFKDLAILMLSAETLDLATRQGTSMPHDDHLTKPFKISELLDRIQVLLDLEWFTIDKVVSHNPVHKAVSQIPPHHKQFLLELAKIGHARGIEDHLKEIVEENPNLTQPITELRTIIKRFDFDHFVTLLERADHD